MQKSTYLILTAVLFLSSHLFAQSKISKTIVTSLGYEADVSLVLDLEGPVEVKEWSKDYIRVVIKVTTNLQHDGTLDLLVENDRYFVDTSVDQFQNMIINNPYLKKGVTVNGKSLQEFIQYEVYVPDYTPVQVLETKRNFLAGAHSKKLQL